MRAAVAIEWSDREWSDRKWLRDEVLPEFAPALRPGIEREFVRRRAAGVRRDANLWLFDLQQMWRAAPKWIADAHDGDAVDEFAQWAASQVEHKHRAVDLDAFTLRHRLPRVPGDTEAGRLARARDWQWWRRQMRRAVFRYHDQFQRHLGHVHRRAQVYCSDVAVAAQAARQRANDRVLAQLLAISNAGDEVSLLKIRDRSVANPENRRHEVMTRLAGFERFADGYEHRALFATITCPSRFHCRYQKSGNANPAWDGSTPRAASDYLVKLWSRARAALQRARVTFYGFRIAEPHHDGCPHWHVLLWIAGGVPGVKTVQDILRRYAMADSPNEPGARKRRTKFEVIDRAKGSAVGYVAKYIAKSIDGFGVGEDLFGNPAEAAASRIVAWARTWGIRQFQQIGGPSVTAWREYRRLQPDEGRIPFHPDTPHKEPWMDASLRSDWCAFYKSVGSGRAQRTQLHRQHRTTLQFGAPCVLLNRYGERPPPPVVGLLRDGVFLNTHPQQWSIKRCAPTTSAPDLAPECTAPGVAIRSVPASMPSSESDRPPIVHAARDRLIAMLTAHGAAAMNMVEGTVLTWPACLDIPPSKPGGPLNAVWTVPDVGAADTWTRVNNCTPDPARGPP